MVKTQISLGTEVLYIVKSLLNCMTQDGKNILAIHCLFTFRVFRKR
ncbi:hypothetical protein Smp_199570 [Schistosoma mansoni]|nr:hypothetical protein Smp_199570 [Schistosoma mansoni]|eukprot:XP_018644717.1 hypothetical protein Smp_199570 [Schistosoma mansoni]